MGSKLQKLEEEQGRRNIEKGGLGHVDKHPVDFAQEFKAAFKGTFFHGDKPGHIDLSVYGFLANLLYCQTQMGEYLLPLLCEHKSLLLLLYSDAHYGGDLAFQLCFVNANCALVVSLIENMF